MALQVGLEDQQLKSRIGLNLEFSKEVYILSPVQYFLVPLMIPVAIAEQILHTWDPQAQPTLASLRTPAPPHPLQLQIMKVVLDGQ